MQNVKWIIGSLDKNSKEFKKCEVLIHFASAGVANRNLPFKKAFDTEKERQEAQRKWQMEHYLRNKEQIKQKARERYREQK